MRKLIVAFALGFATLFSPLALGSVAAQFDDRFCNGGGGAGTAFCMNQSTGDETNNEFTGSDGLLSTIVDYITTITIIAAIIVILIASIMYITSGGDPGKANRARSAIIYAVIALALSVSVRVIVLFVLSRASNAL